MSTKSIAPKYIDRLFLSFINTVARQIGRKFNLKTGLIKTFHPKDPCKRSCLGLCINNKNILIQFRNKKFFRMESILDTLCHEMAHLKYDLHNKMFWAYKHKIENWMYRELF